MKINSDKYVVLVTPEIKETVYQASVEIAGLMDDHDEGAIEMSALELLQSHITKLEKLITDFVVEHDLDAQFVQQTEGLTYVRFVVEEDEDDD